MNEELVKIQAEYPKIFEEAYDCVKEMRVKKYVFKPSGRVRWVVVGRTRDYLALPSVGYCSCEDFFFRVMSHEKPMCYHVVAVKLAQITEKYDVIEESDEWHWRLMREWLSDRFSEV
ncbi:MAG: SWIM zinc finger family protein [Candidatus Caldarchaeum sp.]|nr:SWIM zinc finger family protein [Candidatus Caldarchaeum sp.]MCS7136865.1 SWIM zinc finger family protein [Candidatus Caldarchaeum sp.]MDW7977617.1 SWIM zinc finger family protein [Candidatus Caldarchaeum sp.]MDW8360247.1 SWIM zinc finger family protein [Candidatus Caldarchaeum sp.]